MDKRKYETKTLIAEYVHCEVSEDDYETWKFIRSNDTGSFINWEEEQMKQFEEWKNEMFKTYDNEHKKVLELINIDELPF